MWSRPGVRAAVAIVFVVVAGLVIRNQIKVANNREADRLAKIEEERKQAEEYARTTPIREELWNEVQPVPLKKCNFKRFGEENDGGYLLCSNLLYNVTAGYSYGISGYDGWGCDVATRRSIPVHQYDCFNTTVPVCKTGKTIFHGECVGGTKKTEDGRPFDTVYGQMTKNGDAEHHVVIKMDVEGAEWESIPAMSDEALQRVDQFIFEFHGVKYPNYIDVVKRLKKFFYVAYFHVNNFSCAPGHEPFGGWAYEVLFVNKALDEVDPTRTEVGAIEGIAKNHPKSPDCQGRTAPKPTPTTVPR